MKHLFTDKNLEAALQHDGMKKQFSDGTIVINPGDKVRFVPIVLSGSMRIMLQQGDGAEYFLYHIYPGETCAMSLSCCMSERPSEIKAVADGETEVLFVPVEKAAGWMQFPEWKKYVSETQAQRFSELLETIGLIAFSKLDEQVWNYLVRKVQATGHKELSLTHQEIATELNSPREVVTRLLHKLQESGRIRLGRNKIEVISVM